jgi:hypothetical protein
MVPPNQPAQEIAEVGRLVSDFKSDTGRRPPRLGFRR